MKEVGKIEIIINGQTLLPNEEIQITPGNYKADINVIYVDGTRETIKDQEALIDGKDKKVILDMISFKARLINTFVDKKLLIAMLIIIVIVGGISNIATELGNAGIFAGVIALAVVSRGNDYYYKKYGFDETFRATIK